METIYTVTGMTCGCCASSVAEQVTAIEGVTNVTVDVSTGSLTVTSDQEISAKDVRVAVEEAGYQLTA